MKILDKRLFRGVFGFVPAAAIGWGNAWIELTKSGLFTHVDWDQRARNTGAGIGIFLVLVSLAALCYASRKTSWRWFWIVFGLFVLSLIACFSARAIYQGQTELIGIGWWKDAWMWSYVFLVVVLLQLVAAIFMAVTAKD
ncbi:hypothetical protein ACC848_05665 [Rhizobium johnstonii]|uniref:hypothetical protein n=1 Tax=Rhizobium johnstonii TaxID=3019933 RepID=UPI003F94D86C